MHSTFLSILISAKKIESNNTKTGHIAIRKLIVLCPSQDTKDRELKRVFGKLYQLQLKVDNLDEKVRLHDIK